MKLRQIYIRHILLAVFLILCFQDRGFSQGTDIAGQKQQNLYIGLSLEPSQTLINNEGTLAVSSLLSNKMASFSGTLEIGYLFSNNFGLSSGLGFISYKTQLTLGAYQNNFIAIDSENESYERRVSGSGIKEEQKISTLCIPLYVNLRLPVNKTMGFFLQTGFNMSFPLSKNYTSIGTFTYKGYYPAYNVLLEGIPEHGFASNIGSDDSGDLEIKPFGLNAIISGGVDIFFQENMQIAFAIFYNRSLSNISNYSSPDKFQLSPDPDHLNSLMGGSSKATVQSLGLKIILRYYLK
jgi:hypothetical protein